MIFHTFRKEFTLQKNVILNIHQLISRGLKFTGVTEVGEGCDLWANNSLCLKCCTRHLSLKQNI